MISKRKFIRAGRIHPNFRCDKRFLKGVKHVLPNLNEATEAERKDEKENTAE